MRSISVSPKPSKSIRSQLGVAHRVLYVSMPEVGLNRTGIVTCIGELEAASMPKHVRVNLQLESCGFTSSRYHPGKPGRSERRSPFAHEYKLAISPVSLQPAKYAHFAST